MTAGVLGVTLLLGALYAPGLLLETRRHEATIDELEVANDSLRDSAARFESDLARLSSRLDQFQSQANRLANELGIQDLPGLAAAGGESIGMTAPDPIGTEVDILASRADLLDESLAQIDAAHQRRIAILSSTPNMMPVRGWFSHGFGWRKDPWTGDREFHRGIDIVADSGTRILAPADGVISGTARKPDYGKVVDVSHGFGYVTRFAHMSEILVKPGQRIRRGDVIGRVGSTGRSTGPHLHYEVFRDGRRVNPWKYLGQRGS
jgi:murein DD-endopeptidase MepM/ murein hydrolase activator NlpD